LPHAPTDPNYDRLGSLNLTHNVIEEAGEIVQKARTAFTSRKNRQLNKKYGITGKTILTCNPSQNFIREQFYEPYVALGGGDCQTWEFENENGEPVYVEVGGVRHRARRAFIRSLPTDNPFLSENYIEVLNSLPPSERKRLKDGDWDYQDDENQLSRAYLIRTADEAPTDAVKYAGCDPSRGGDGCIFSELSDHVVTDMVRIDIPKGDPDLDIGTYVG